MPIRNTAHEIISRPDLDNTPDHRVAETGTLMASQAVEPTTAASATASVPLKKTMADAVRQQTDTVLASTTITASTTKNTQPPSGDGFTVVHRKARHPKKRINGCRRDVVSFSGVQKKSVVCVSRLAKNTSTDIVSSFLSSSGINVCSCYIAGVADVNSNNSGEDSTQSNSVQGKKVPNYSTMQICILSGDMDEVLSPELWPEGVTVRPWKFKRTQSS